MIWLLDPTAYTDKNGRNAEMLTDEMVETMFRIQDQFPSFRENGVGVVSNGLFTIEHVNDTVALNIRTDIPTSYRPLAAHHETAYMEAITRILRDMFGLRGYYL